MLERLTRAVSKLVAADTRVAEMRELRQQLGSAKPPRCYLTVEGALGRGIDVSADDARRLIAAEIDRQTTDVERLRAVLEPAAAALDP